MKIVKESKKETEKVLSMEVFSNAEEKYNMQKSIYEDKTNLVALLDNIVMFNDRYDVSNDVKKIAIYL